MAVLQARPPHEDEMPATLTISLNGTTELPAGTIAAIVTSLEMHRPPPPRADPSGTEGLALVPLRAAETQRYLAIYRVLGERWMWFSRLVRPQSEIAAILGDPAVEAFAVTLAGRDIGLLELDFRVAGEGELAFLGLAEGAVGQGAGRWLMNRALELAWARPIARFWVHTCTLDHPAAPGFYQRSGFRVFRRGVDVAPDPRLSGAMPPDAAAHHPVIAP